jgi:hypothetical protein
MFSKVLPPDSKELTFICGLGRPEVTRFYLSQRRPGLWEFWAQPADSRAARMVFGWLAEESRSEVEVAKRLLVDYLGAFQPSRISSGDPVQGLLSIREIETVLERHRARDQPPRLGPRSRPNLLGPSAA